MYVDAYIDLDIRSLKNLIDACFFNYINREIDPLLKELDKGYAQGVVRILCPKKRFDSIADDELVKAFDDQNVRGVTLRELIMLHLDNPLPGSAVNIARGSEIVLNSRRRYPGIFRQGGRHALDLVSLPESGQWGYVRFPLIPKDNI